MPAKTQGTAMRRSQGKAPKAQATAKPAARGKKAARAKTGATAKTAGRGGTKASQAKATGKRGKKARIEQVRRRVARPRPGQPPRRKVPAEQEDPSIMAPPAPPTAPVDGLHQNWGDAKNKAVTRLDKPTNWFRQAAKPKSK